MDFKRNLAVFLVAFSFAMAVPFISFAVGSDAPEVVTPTSGFPPLDNWLYLAFAAAVLIIATSIFGIISFSQYQQAKSLICDKYTCPDNPLSELESSKLRSKNGEGRIEYWADLDYEDGLSYFGAIETPLEFNDAQNTGAIYSSQLETPMANAGAVYSRPPGIEDPMEINAAKTYQDYSQSVGLLTEPPVVTERLTANYGFEYQPQRPAAEGGPMNLTCDMIQTVLMQLGGATGPALAAQPDDWEEIDAACDPAVQAQARDLFDALLPEFAQEPRLRVLHPQDAQAPSATAAPLPEPSFQQPVGQPLPQPRPLPQIALPELPQEMPLPQPQPDQAVAAGAEPVLISMVYGDTEAATPVDPETSEVNQPLQAISQIQPPHQRHVPQLSQRAQPYQQQRVLPHTQPFPVITNIQQLQVSQPFAVVAAQGYTGRHMRVGAEQGEREPMIRPVYPMKHSRAAVSQEMRKIS